MVCTQPSAGIDLEPDGPTQPLVNITIRRCQFNNNDGNGINSWLNSFTLDQDCEAVNQRLGIKDYWFNCSVPPLYPVSIDINNCHVHGGNPVVPPVQHHQYPNSTTRGSGQGGQRLNTGGGFVFGHIGPSTAGKISIRDSTVTGTPGFGVFTWDLDPAGAHFELRNVTLNGTATLRKFIAMADGAHPVVYAPVGASNSFIELDGVVVFDSIARPWLQVLSNCQGCEPNFCQCNGTKMSGTVTVHDAGNGQCAVNGSATRWNESLSELRVKCTELPFAKKETRWYGT